MKTFKILFAAVIFAGFATSAVGQGTDDATATSRARVVAELEIDKNTDISWGDVAQSTNPTINPITGESSESGLNDTDVFVGKFTIDGTEGANILITATHNNLTGPGEDPIIWVPALSYLASNGENEGAESGGDNIDNESGQLLGNGGKGMVFVGGGITIAADQMPGTYEGDITVTVAYN